MNLLKQNWKVIILYITCGILSGSSVFASSASWGSGVITSISPTSIVPGETILTISGSGFQVSGTRSSAYVYFNYDYPYISSCAVVGKNDPMEQNGYMSETNEQIVVRAPEWCLHPGKGTISVDVAWIDQGYIAHTYDITGPEFTVGPQSTPTPNPTPAPLSCPTNSYSNGDHCTCFAGYVVNQTGSACIVASTPVPTPLDSNSSCKNQFGYYAITSPDKPGYCTCMGGYDFDINKQCVPIPIFTPTPTPAYLSTPNPSSVPNRANSTKHPKSAVLTETPTPTVILPALPSPSIPPQESTPSQIWGWLRIFKFWQWFR